MITTPDFQETLSWGQVGEGLIARWLRSRGWTILPVYEKELHTGKGPRLYTAFASGYDELIATDMLAMRGKTIQWVEAKRKTHFTWRKYPPNAKTWQTGIDLRHYQHYLHVREHTQIPLWLLFLHEVDIPSEADRRAGSPLVCPTGLYGGEIAYLKTVEAHQDGYTSHGREYPMVYWTKDTLKHLARLSDVLENQEVAA